MTKIIVPSLLKRNLIVPDVSNNPEVCFVSEARGEKVRMYLIGDKRHKNGRRMGVKAERQGSWKVVSSSRIFSRYVLPSGTYLYKCEGVLFLTTLEEALVQAGFNIHDYPD